MSLEYAVERLYEMGWTPGFGTSHATLDDGRSYPTSAQIQRDFDAAGLKLTVRYVGLFNCHRAEWSGAAQSGSGHWVEAPAAGYCVGATEAEALVFAYAQLVRSRAVMGVGV